MAHTGKSKVIVFICAAHLELDNMLFWKPYRSGDFLLVSILGHLVQASLVVNVETVKCYIHYREFLRKSEKTVQREPAV